MITLQILVFDLLISPSILCLKPYILMDLLLMLWYKIILFLFQFLFEEHKTEKCILNIIIRHMIEYNTNHIHFNSSFFILLLYFTLFFNLMFLYKIRLWILCNSNPHFEKFHFIIENYFIFLIRDILILQFQQVHIRSWFYFLKVFYNLRRN